jgi:hypothetical protein
MSWLRPLTSRPSRPSVLRVLSILSVLLASPLGAQVAGKFPPDSLVNPKFFARGTPVRQVLDRMRGMSLQLGVRCQYCHLGEEGKPLSTFDFASDEKRTKQTAREMLHLVAEINRRLDTLPQRPANTVEVTCRTCHRGVSRPETLASLVVQSSLSHGPDSAAVLYQRLRDRYFGRDAYDFGEQSLNAAASDLAGTNRYDLAFAAVALNDRQFPASATLAMFRGELELGRSDTTAAAAAFREALRRDPQFEAARRRLTEIKRAP